MWVKTAVLIGHLSASELTPSLVQQLLDQHGTGRVLFRNTRQAIDGFPERLLQPYPLSSASEVNDLEV